MKALAHLRELGRAESHRRSTHSTVHNAPFLTLTLRMPYKQAENRTTRVTDTMICKIRTALIEMHQQATIFTFFL